MKPDRLRSGFIISPAFGVGECLLQSTLLFYAGKTELVRVSEDIREILPRRKSRLHEVFAAHEGSCHILSVNFKPLKKKRF